MPDAANDESTENSRKPNESHPIQSTQVQLKEVVG